jgi:hypothetical protein
LETILDMQATLMFRDKIQFIKLILHLGEVFMIELVSSISS